MHLNSKNILNFLRHLDIDSAISELGKPFSKKKQNLVLEIIYSNTSKLDLYLIAVKFIIIWKKSTKLIGRDILKNLWLEDKVDLQVSILKMLENENWHESENGAQVLSQLIISSFEPVIEWISGITSGLSSTSKRGISVACKYAIQEMKCDSFHELFKLITPFFSIRDEYVRKNLGSFTIGDGFLRICPNLTLTKLEELAKLDNEVTRWNVARSFSSSGGKKLGERVIPILSHLAEDERKFVIGSVVSSLRYIKKNNITLFEMILNNWRGDREKHLVLDILLS